VAVEQVHVYPWGLQTPEGAYVARAYADQQPGGLWEGWLAFFPVSAGEVLATDRETTQSKRSDVDYWASGLTATYLEGALRRALDRRPEAQLARLIARAGSAEAYARAEARMYEAAATEARAAARRAEASRKSAEARLDRS
jgi:hypothetical protein